MGLRQSRETSIAVMAATGDLVGLKSAINDAIRENPSIAVSKLIDSKTEDGDFPLSLSCAHGHPAVARELIERGASINAADANGWTPLICAFMGQQWEICELLISLPGLNLNSQSATGLSALMLACQSSHFALVTALVNAGASIDLMDSEWKTALLFAALAGDRRSVRFLIENGANWLSRARDGANAVKLLGREFVFRAVEKRRKFIEELLKEIHKENSTANSEARAEGEAATELDTADEDEEIDWVELTLEFCGDGGEERRGFRIGQTNGEQNKANQQNTEDDGSDEDEEGETGSDAPVEGRTNEFRAENSRIHSTTENNSTVSTNLLIHPAAAAVDNSEVALRLINDENNHDDVELAKL